MVEVEQILPRHATAHWVRAGVVVVVVGEDAPPLLGVEFLLRTTIAAALLLVIGDDDDLAVDRPLRLHELGVLAAEVLTIRLLRGLCLEVLPRLSVLPSHRRAYHTRRWRDEVDRRNPKREVQPRGSVVEPDLLLFILHHRGLRRVVRPGPLPLVGLPVGDLRHPCPP